MARLPDAADLGLTPTPSAGRPVPNIPAVGQGVQQGANIMTADANRSGAGLGGFAQGLNAFGQQIAQAEDRLRTREDAVARAHSYSAFFEGADNELRKAQTETDFGSLKAVEKYGTFLRDHTQKIIGAYEGSDEGRLLLTERLEAARLQFASQATSLSMEAQDKKVMGLMESRINGLVSRTWQSPGSLVKQFQDLDREIDDMAPALKQGQEADFRRVGRERIAEASLGALISRGGIDQAEKLLATPGLSEILGERAQARVQGQIISARQILTNAQMQGLAERTRFQALFGRPPANEAELLNFIGKGGPKEDAQTISIGDATSPTATRIIPRSMVGQTLTPEILSKFPPGPPGSGIDMKFDKDGKLVSLTTGRAGEQKPGVVPGMGTAGSNQVDQDLLGALATRQSLQAITQKFKPEFQQIPARLGMAWDALKDKAGADLGEAEKKGLTEYTKFRAEAGQMFSNILKQLSGVAVNPTEMKRAETYLPAPGTGITDGDSPTEMKAKIERFTEFNNNAIARLAYTKAHGVKFDTVNIDDMPAIIRRRGNEIAQQMQELGHKGADLNAKVRDALAREFGFVGP